MSCLRPQAAAAATRVRMPRRATDAGRADCPQLTFGLTGCHFLLPIAGWMPVLRLGLFLLVYMFVFLIAAAALSLFRLSLLLAVALLLADKQFISSLCCHTHTHTRSVVHSHRTTTTSIVMYADLLTFALYCLLFIFFAAFCGCPKGCTIKFTLHIN